MFQATASAFGLQCRTAADARIMPREPSRGKYLRATPTATVITFPRESCNMPHGPRPFLRHSEVPLP
jgi:hypothetical protein